MVAVRAIYQDGQLRLLEPVDLQDGQEVQIQILDRPDSLLDAVADLLATVDEPAESEDDDEDAIQREIDAALKGKRPLSEIIIEDRHEGS